ncbi:PAS domain S-box protein [Leptolyngbya sp. AN03gr2]|uniref:PAS domain S-box protein n=1 Tax=unclassified Leptolyngbya TaxID=2650499 RepID=UPI003D30F6B0
MPTLLLVEDHALDRELYRRYLTSDSSEAYSFVEADCVAVALELCRTQTIDAVLLDYVLPDGNGLFFLRSLQAQSRGKTPAVVMISGRGDETVAVQAIKLGAEDYLVKQRLTPELLQLTLRSAIENTRLRLQLRQSEERYRAIVEDQTELICRFTPEGTLTFVNQAYSRYFGSTPDQLMGQNFLTLVPERDRPAVQEQLDELSAVTPENAIITHEHPVLKPEGEIGWQQWTNRAIFDDDGQLVGLQAVGRDITDRKLAEIALQEREQRYRAIFNTTYQFTGLLTPDGTLIEANQTALDFGGLTYEDVLNRPFWEAKWWTISTETQAQLREAIARAAQGEFVRYEVEVLGAGDSTTVIDFSLKPVCDESGQVVLIIPEGRDISDRVRSEVERIQHEVERRQAQQRLRESEERLQLGIQVAGVALAKFDYKTNSVELSPEAATLYGLLPDELVVTRHRIHATFHPDDRAELAQIIQQVISPTGSGWFAREHRVVWENGEVRWLQVRKQVFFDRSGETPRPDYAILAAIDVTERKHAEQRLQESSERLQLGMQVAGFALAKFDYRSNTVDLSPEAAALYGIDSEGLIVTRDRVHATFHSEEREELFAIISQVLDPAGEGWFAREHRVVWQNGEVRWLSVRKQVFFDRSSNSPRPSYAILAAVDVTDRKLAEAERERLLAQTEAARAEAEAANRSKDEFVAVVAHELRSPLNSISGWAKILQTRRFDEVTLEKALDTIVRNTEAQVQLVEDLLSNSHYDF